MSSSFNYLLLFFTNSILTFFCLAIAVEAFLWIFQVKNYRWRSSLRFIPFINLALFNLFNVGSFLNPLHCDSCIQHVLLALNSELKNALGNDSLLRYCARCFPNIPYAAATYAFVIFTSIYFLYKAQQLIRSVKWLQEMIEQSTLFEPAIQNAKLKQHLVKRNIRIYLTAAISSPTAVFANEILIPVALAQKLTTEEMEAVLAHEAEHLYWRDSFIKCFVELSTALFWWVPVKWWYNRLSLDQEMACDLAIYKYEMNKESMASSLLKGLKSKQSYSFNLYAMCNLYGNSMKHRMNALLYKNYVPKKLVAEIAFISFMLLISLVCLVK